ncbi:glycosyltransferase family 9 protein [bacterium]|nr:MAG: glycosyltransferase family 9 protein [bacterium]
MPVKNILVIRDDRFGEFLLNIPALRALKERYPAADLTLAVKADVRELAQCVEYSDRVIVWDDDFRRSLRKQRFDICVVLDPTKEAHWQAFFAGIPIRVGYNRKWGFLLTRKIEDNKSLGLKHEVEYNLDLVGLVEAKTNDKSLSLGKLPTHTDPEYAGAIAIHPYTSDPLKQWPIERFMELARRIAREMKVKVVLVGKAPSSIGMADELVNLVNKTSLVELAQILRQCRLLVSCDSGPMHLAASVGTRVVALFRHDLPGKTARRWGPWGKGHIVIERANLNEITVDEVLKNVLEMKI